MSIPAMLMRLNVHKFWGKGARCNHIEGTCWQIGVSVTQIVHFSSKMTDRRYTKSS